MATEEIVDKQLSVISLSKQEAVNLIGLLTAQLGNVALKGNASGSAPELNIIKYGQTKYRLVFCLEKE